MQAHQEDYISLDFPCSVVSTPFFILLLFNFCCLTFFRFLSSTLFLFLFLCLTLNSSALELTSLTPSTLFEDSVEVHPFHSLKRRPSLSPQQNLPISSPARPGVCYATTTRFDVSRWTESSVNHLHLPHTHHEADIRSLPVVFRFHLIFHIFIHLLSFQVGTPLFFSFFHFPFIPLSIYHPTFSLSLLFYLLYSQISRADRPPHFLILMGVSSGCFLFYLFSFVFQYFYGLSFDQISCVLLDSVRCGGVLD